MDQMTETPSQETFPPARRRGMARWVFWLRAGLVVSLMPLVFLAATAVMVIDRDITAPSWIEDRVAARLAEVLPDATLDFGTITLRVGRDLHPRVRLLDTRLVDAGGLTLTRVPVVEAQFSPRGLVLQRALLVQDVALVGAQFNLRRAADGTLSLALGGGGLGPAGARSLPEVLAQLDDIFAIPPLAALEQVRADGVIVNFDDARAGRSWIVDQGGLALDLRGGQTSVRGDFALLAGRADVTAVQLAYVSTRGSPAARVGLTLQNGVASDLATQSPALRWLADIDAPISATLRTELDAQGALGPLNGRLQIGAGVFQPNPGTPPVRFDEAAAYFTFDPVRDLVTFTEMRVQSDWGRLRGNGTAYLREFRSGLPGAILAQLRLSDVAVNPAGLYAAPPAVPELSVDLRARFDPFVLDIGEVVALDGDSRLTARGRIAATDAGWDVALDAQMDHVTPARVADFWPVSVRPGTRDWFVNNVTGGTLQEVVWGLRRLPERPWQLALGFGFADTTIRFMRDMPPITAQAGVASLEEHRFVVSLDRGQVLAPQGGVVDLAGTDFSIADLRQTPMRAIFDLEADSSVTAALSILNQRPFEYMDRARIPVTIAEGRARTRGQIAWPLMLRPDPDAVSVAVTSELTEVRSATLVPGRGFSSPRLQVSASRAGVNIAGPVTVGGLRVVGAWEQRFGDPDRPGSRVLANVSLSEEALLDLGISLPAGTIAGRATGEFAITFGRGGAPEFTLTSDLQGMTVAIPAVGWQKGPAEAGSLEVAGTLGPVPQIDRFEIAGAGLQATGRIALTEAGQLAEAVFNRVRIGNWLDAPITLVGRGAGAPVGVRIAGGMLDLRGPQLRGAGAAGGPMSVKLDRLQVTEGIALQGFAGDFRNQDGFRGEFTASLNGTAQVAGTVAPRDGRSAVRLRSDDAGAMLRATGLSANASGGAFDLTLLPGGAAGTFDGTLSAKGVRLRNAPAMAALLDAISVVGLLQQLDGQGLAFDEVDASFRITPTELILAEASAVGPGLGISADGTYTLVGKTLDLQGVVSPFYLVNGLGAFLTRRGEGLIGFSFAITGSTDAPQVSVNPLSVLTPGMFREIFRRPAPDISQ